MVDEWHLPEQFERAVEALVDGAGGIRDRLMDAAIEIHVVRAESLPPDLRAELMDVWAQLAKNQSKPVRIVRNGKVDQLQTGRLAETIPYMRTDQARDLARRVRRLRDGVRKAADASDLE